MKEKFISHKFSEQALVTIDLVNQILEEYRKQDFRLSLRQLYYQLVARGYIVNTQRSYKNLGNLISTARQAGYVDWSMIEDRGRETVALSHWSGPGEIARAAALSFRINKWSHQFYHIEVMVEKDALSGVLGPVCNELDISITANKGYSSSSTMYEIGKRLERATWGKKNVVVLYLGDHDPSGIDMTRDIEERLTMYSHDAPIEVERLALNWDQIEKWQPPENPAKETDARFESYVRQYGESSWELDAVEPGELANLVRRAVLARRDDELWQQAIELEEEQRKELLVFAAKYDKYKKLRSLEFEIIRRINGKSKHPCTKTTILIRSCSRICRRRHLWRHHVSHRHGQRISGWHLGRSGHGWCGHDGS